MNTPLVSSMSVLYIGGINSTGFNAARLRHSGYKVTRPVLTNQNITATLAKILPFTRKNITRNYLQKLQDEVLSQVTEKPDLVIGVSQGGAVAMSLQHYFPRLLLVAPAWKTYGVEPVVPQGTIILHGTNDWIVSPNDSQILYDRNKCTLIKYKGEGHNLWFGGILREVAGISRGLGKHKSEYLEKRKQLDD